MKTDDVIRSMKSQMVPSDDVINDLLAKIAVESASPSTANNVIDLESAAKVKAVKRKTKPVWYYGTAAVASVIVLMSTFMLMNGTDGKTPDDLYNNIVNNPEVATNVDGIKPGTDAENDDKSQNSSEAVVSPAPVTASEGKDAESGYDDSTTAPQSEKAPENEKSPEGDSSSAPTSDSKDNPPTEWTREILAESTISQISVDDSKYVMNTLTLGTVKASKISRISVDIPKTSTTDAVTANADVYEIKKVSPKLAVLVEVEGFSQSLLYTGMDYSPETLGEFLQDAGLEESTSFSPVVNCRTSANSDYVQKNVANIKELINSNLFVNQSSAIADYDSYEAGATHVLFKSINNPTGTIMDFGVSNSGYMYIRMSSGHNFTFNIGKDASQKFIAAVTGNN